MAPAKLTVRLLIISTSIVIIDLREYLDEQYFHFNYRALL